MTEQAERERRLVSLTVEPNFYCDCDGPYCLKGNLQDMKLHLKFQDPHTTGHPRVCEIDHTFETMSWDGGCKPPDWHVCCGEKGISLDFDLDRFLDSDWPGFISKSSRRELSGSGGRDCGHCGDRIEFIRDYLNAIFAEDVHAKRIDSLAGEGRSRRPSETIAVRSATDRTRP